MDAEQTLPPVSSISDRLTIVEHQNRAILFLSAANMFVNVATLVIWFLIFS